MSKKHITIVRITPRIYPTEVGSGPAKHAFFASKYSSNSKIKFINIASKSHLPISDLKNNIKQISPDFEIHYLPIYSIKLTENSIYAQLTFFLWFNLLTIIELFRINRKDRIDIIHIHSPPITALPAIFFKFLFKIPYIYTYHGLDYRFLAHHYFQVLIINRFASKIITITKRIKNYIRKLNNKDILKTVSIPNGIECPNDYKLIFQNEDQKSKFISELEEDAVLANQKIILYVAKQQILQKTQGIIDFVEVFDEFISEWKSPDRNILKLYIIGTGRYRNLLKKAILGLNNQNQIKLLGFRPDVPKFFAIAELSALTSYVEGFPNVILESMVAGVPCVATDVGDVKEIIGNSGFIVSPGDKLAIKDALFTFFEDITLQKTLRKRSYQRVRKKYDWVNVGKILQLIYLKTYKLKYMK